MDVIWYKYFNILLYNNKYVYIKYFKNKKKINFKKKKK